jgi:hypothetical protein
VVPKYYNSDITFINVHKCVQICGFVVIFTSLFNKIQERRVVCFCKAGNRFFSLQSLRSVFLLNKTGSYSSKTNRSSLTFNSRRKQTLLFKDNLQLRTCISFAHFMRIRRCFFLTSKDLRNQFQPMYLSRLGTV